MSRITLQTVATAQDAAKPRLQAALDANGFLPNLLAVLANAPTALQMYQEVGKINAATSLSPTEIEVIQITAAADNGCDFCVAGHSKIAKAKLRLDDATVSALQRRTRPGDGKLAALQTFTLAIINKRGKVSDDELQAFYAAGYGEQQVLEVILGVALATLCNYANNLAQTEINPELQPFAAPASN